MVGDFVGICLSSLFLSNFIYVAKIKDMGASATEASCIIRYRDNDRALLDTKQQPALYSTCLQAASNLSVETPSTLLHHRTTDVKTLPSEFLMSPVGSRLAVTSSPCCTTPTSLYNLDLH